MTSLEEIFERFLKERTYLKELSPQTLTFYRSSFRAYQRFSGSATLPTKADLNAFVVSLRERGIGTATCNTYIQQRTWRLEGFITSVLNILTWSLLGLVWWKYLE